MKFKSKIYIDYDDVLSMCHNLEHDVSKFKPDIIVGIVRGGLLPALHLSHALDRPLVTITWQTRDVSKREYNTELQDAILSGKRVVFVDDINDTGKTFNTINDAYQCQGNNVTFASLICKSDSSFRVNTQSVLTIEDERWLVLPWEKD